MGFFFIPLCILSMLIIDLYPSTAATCSEGPKSATRASFNLRLKKEGGKMTACKHFGPQKWLFALIGLTFGPNNNLRSPTGINTVYKTLGHSHTKRLIDSTLLPFVWDWKGSQMGSEGVPQTDKYSPTYSDSYLLTLNSMASFEGEGDPWLVPISQLWSRLVAHTQCSCQWNLDSTTQAKLQGVKKTF